MKKYTNIATLIFAIICISTISTFAQTFESLQKDFDKGMQGDTKAFKTAMKQSEELLAKNPKDSETLVLHGSATLFQAGQAFQTGNFGEGGKLWQKGQTEMDQAVKISPDNVNVLMTRGTTYLSASKQFPVKEEADRLFKIGIGDYEKITLDKNFKQFPEGLRSQILFALAEGYVQMKDNNKARDYYQILSTDATGKIKEKAVKWLEKNKQ
jgi:tetratricopeptide (TPR) repeat protein